MTLSQDLQHSFEVRSSLDNVWTFFWDIQALARCLAGCESVDVQADGKSYRARIRRKVAVFSIGFELDIEVIETQPPCSVSLRITGKDKRLRSELVQQLVARLQAIDPQVSRVDINTSIQLSGLLASLSKNIVSMQFTQALDDFAANVGAAIELRASRAVAIEPQETKPEAINDVATNAGAATKVGASSAVASETQDAKLEAVNDFATNVAAAFEVRTSSAVASETQEAKPQATNELATNTDTATEAPTSPANASETQEAQETKPEGR